MDTAEVTFHDPDRIQPWHEVRDVDKYEQLADDMAARGWVGPPLVVVTEPGRDPTAVTGSHRLAAARVVELDVPAVELADLCHTHGIDVAALIAEEQDCGLSFDDALYEVVTRGLDEHLPADVMDFYGLDAH